MFTWPYNYFVHFDNRTDHAHQPLVHPRGGAKRRARNQSRGTGITLSGYPPFWLKETDWGYTGVRSYENGVTRIEYIVMPNIHLHKSRPGNPRPEDPPSGWRDTIRWIVPVDYEHFVEVSLYGLLPPAHLPGAARPGRGHAPQGMDLPGRASRRLGLTPELTGTLGRRERHGCNPGSS